MEKKTASSIMLTLLLTSMLTLAFNIQPVKAIDPVYINPIYIKSDGSINPPTAPIKRNGDLYTLTNNITFSYYGIVIERNNMTLDGAGYTIQTQGILGYTIQTPVTCMYAGGNAVGDAGINLTERMNVTISNMKIRRFSCGILLEHSSKNSVVGSTTTHTNGDGMSLRFSSCNVIDGSNINDAWDGIVLYASSNNSIGGNNITAMLRHCIRLESGSSNNNISANNITNNGEGIAIDGSTNNNINGNKIADTSDGIWLTNFSHHTTIVGNSMTNISEAIHIASSSYISIVGNNITGNNKYHGIGLYKSSNINISGNELNDVGWQGIILDISSNNRISGNNITAYRTYGVWLKNSTDNNISANNIVGCDTADRTEVGVWLDSSNRNSVSGNNITSNLWYGVVLFFSSNNRIGGNNIRDNGMGMLFSAGSSDNILRTNNMANKEYNLVFFGFFNDIDISNTVDGKPIYYWVNEADRTIPPDAGYVALVNCTRITVQNLTLTKNGEGILLAYTTNSTIIRNNIKCNLNGICLRYSLGNSLVGNNITANNGDGIYLTHSSDNRIIENSMTANNDNGIGISNSSSNIIYFNNFTNNKYNEAFDYSFEDILIPFSINVWDDGYPSGGNYWSDYAGVDLHNGQHLNETGSDGIGDTAYNIDGLNIDHYPRMGGSYDSHATSEHHAQAISNSTISDFQFSGTVMSFIVSGENATTGFCRICIPTALMNGTYKVFVNNTEIQFNLLPCSNSTFNYLYFTYTLSTKEIVIVPEFPSLLILPLFMITILVATIVYRRKHST